MLYCVRAVADVGGWSSEDANIRPSRRCSESMGDHAYKDGLKAKAR